MSKHNIPQKVRAGMKGGLKTLQNKGKKHFSDIAKRRWAKVKKISTRGLDR